MRRAASAADLARARIDAHRQQSRVRAGALIISLFGDAVAPRGGRLWVGSLIRLLQPLGIDDRLVRTADAALLRAKAMGRDRVEVAQQRDSFAIT